MKCPSFLILTDFKSMHNFLKYDLDLFSRGVLWLKFAQCLNQVIYELESNWFLK